MTIFPRPHQTLSCLLREEQPHPSPQVTGGEAKLISRSNFSITSNQSVYSEVRNRVTSCEAALTRSHEPASLGVTPHIIALLGIHLTAQRGHQVQQRVLRGTAKKCQ